MLWLNYGMFNVFFYLWTISSVTFYPETYQLYQLVIYTFSALLLILFTFFVCKIDRDGKLDLGMLIVSMLLHIGLSVNYQCAKKYGRCGHFFDRSEELLPSGSDDDVLCVLFSFYCSAFHDRSSLCCAESPGNSGCSSLRIRSKIFQIG